jgi:hypothetical protein
LTIISRKHQRDGNAQRCALVDAEHRFRRQRIARHRLQRQPRDREVDADEPGHQRPWQAQVHHRRTREAAIVDEQQLQHIPDADIGPLPDGQRQQRCDEHCCRKKRVAQDQWHERTPHPQSGPPPACGEGTGVGVTREHQQATTRRRISRDCKSITPPRI